MLHAKFQDHRTSGSGEEDFKSFYHIWAWRPSWSCDLNYINFHPYFLRRLHLNLALIGHVVSKKKMFENNSHIHVHSIALTFSKRGFTGFAMSVLPSLCNSVFL